MPLSNKDREQEPVFLQVQNSSPTFCWISMATAFRSGNGNPYNRVGKEVAKGG